MGLKFDSLFNEDDAAVEQINGAEVRVQSVQELPVEKLVPYSNHPFKLYDGERLKDMIRSVNEVGILVPIVVRDAETGMYEILAGHNRVNVAKQVGLATVPARVLENITDELAALIVTESNLCQRSFNDLMHSERATALKAHLDALKAQGKRNDKLLNTVDRILNGEDVEEESITQKTKSRDIVAEKYDLSPQTVSRYVRLASLNTELLDMVDEERIAFLAGVEIAGLSEDTQQTVADLLNRENLTLTIKHAKALRQASASANASDEDQVRELLLGSEVRKPKAEPTAKVKPKVWKKYFPANAPIKDIESTIDKALAFWFENAGDEG